MRQKRKPLPLWATITTVLVAHSGWIVLSWVLVAGSFKIIDHKWGEPRVEYKTKTVIVEGPERIVFSDRVVYRDRVVFRDHPPASRAPDNARSDGAHSRARVKPIAPSPPRDSACFVPATITVMGPPIEDKRATKALEDAGRGIRRLLLFYDPNKWASLWSKGHRSRIRAVANTIDKGLDRSCLHGIPDRYRRN